MGRLHLITPKTTVYEEHILPVVIPSQQRSSA
jgi:hypothetical protein